MTRGPPVRGRPRRARRVTKLATGCARARGRTGWPRRGPGGLPPGFEDRADSLTRRPPRPGRMPPPNHGQPLTPAAIASTRKPPTAEVLGERQEKTSERVRHSGDNQETRHSYLDPISIPSQWMPVVGSQSPSLARRKAYSTRRAILGEASGKWSPTSYDAGSVGSRTCSTAFSTLFELAPPDGDRVATGSGSSPPSRDSAARAPMGVR